jgi:hemolysin activation/secretion protein
MGANASVMDYKVVVGDQGMVGAVGRAITKGLEWTYPLLRADDRSATVSLAADAKKFENTSAQGLLMSDYQAKVLTAQVSGFYRDLNPGGGSGTYSVQLSNGDLDLTGSLSQQTDKNTTKTEGVFNKIRLNGTWQQAITTQTSAFVSYTGQMADKNLDSSEKMQLGGMNGVRAYPTGEGSGSEGQMIQLELRQQLENGINLAAFYDWGQVWLQHNPDYPGGPKQNLNTYKGFGASMGYTFENGVSVKATWARRDGDNPNPNPINGKDMDGTRDRNRYWLQVNLPF